MSAVMNAGMRRTPAGNRAIHYAVLGSLLLHGVFLFVFSLPRQSESPPATPGPIVARLAQPESVPAPAPQPEPPKPRVEEPPAPPPPPLVKPVPVPKPGRIPAPKVPPPQAQPEPAPSVAAPSIEPAPSVPTQPSPPALMARIDPQPAPPAQSMPDTGALDIYRLELMQVARMYKRYPRAARDNNWEGRVVVRMVIGTNGMISSISVAASTGHELLDKQALDMIKRAKGGVLIPPALRGREFTLEIPVLYSLKDQDSG
jgi:protein TonB